MFKKIAISSAVFAALGLSAGAQAFLIDDFQTGAQDSTTLKGANKVFSEQVKATNAATGYRDVWFGQTTDPSNNGTSVNVFNPAPGVISFNVGSNAAATLIIDWDGNDIGAATGIGGTFDRRLGNTASAMDLTDNGASDAFLFDVVFADQGFDFQIEVVDTSGNLAVFDYPGSTPPIPVELTFPGILFSSFTNYLGTDFKNIRSISLLIQPDARSPDFTIDNFYTGKVPEPATIALFGLGLAGLGSIARRRARKA